ncbi:MAG: M20/M25/M40 family metallo-hydrolase, partial [Nitrospinaceae bacterium]|nr:M20/M25/M40 family metallo-hydrolase [Nitrospinaceae bacterium]NIR55174.1 M20/M25/M40 family metallo-hydrolase [Nitrospinaceae bacterium]NIS85598.1 M20/M25/M40 family metallo-hydrolase [Nitrospinaceae bacterium]NIT82444.1 M20/M25/M40 family metallo-hydrolase [Nitrospinaceae bacterium]NIU44657.1 M20/M25/M40 family metallo-hydrolase [Nitrospinaceae bacterium]
MNSEEWSKNACQRIRQGSDFVQRHLDYMTDMVRIDSRSFNVNEFEGDRLTPTDMQEILALAKDYLLDIGFQQVQINVPPPSPERSTPILMAEIEAGPDKPTLLMYAHLDKQPYMDDHRFEKWGGVPPTELRWNEDGSRAYGRGAADDLSGVVAIGLAVDAVLQTLGFDAKKPAPGLLEQLPCNLKVIFETEEESGSHSLIPQILQNREFFESTDCVIITDVTNPDTGVPGLTTSLRGILQMHAHLRPIGGSPAIDDQTALYKVLSTLIREDHSLAVEDITQEDLPVTKEERQGYEKIPTTLQALRDQAGLLPETRLIVPADKVSVIEAQLRTSYVNIRPGHRVAGGVVFGAAGTRLTLEAEGLNDRPGFIQWLKDRIEGMNRFRVKVQLRELTSPGDSTLTLDLILQSASKDPHSGIIGGPFPVPELLVAKMMDELVGWDGWFGISGWEPFFQTGKVSRKISLQALHVEHDGSARIFDEDSAHALIEIRLGPGQKIERAREVLINYLMAHVPDGFGLYLAEDKGGDPWSTQIDHPAFTQMLKSLEVGYGREPCLYGCGGSIPFVAKLMGALGDVPPLCLGAYDPDCRMHEPGESLSMADL